MEDMIREYLNMQQIQEVVKNGTEVIYTGWHVNNGHEYLHEIQYVPVSKPIKTHTCRIFDQVKINDTTYKCLVCMKEHDQQNFERICKTAPVKHCNCGGNTKKMALHIPHPVSGWQTSPIFYACSSCGSKYMFYKSRCQNECCRNTCDRSEVYCISCQKLIDKA
jgi:hypothetical protein